MSTEVRKHTFTWKIENINLCTEEKNECLQSPLFKAENLYESTWCIELYLRDLDSSKEGWMGCYLRRQDDNGPSKIECNFALEVLDIKGNVLFSGSAAHKFEKDDDWGFSNAFKNSTLLSDNFHSDDFLVIRCEMKVNAQKYPLHFKNSCLTKINTNKYSLEWIVKNLNSNCSELIKIPYKKSQIEIAVQVPEDDIKVTIRRIGDMTESLSVTCQVSLLDVAGIKQDSKHDVHLFEDSSVENGTWEFPTFLKRSKLNAEKEKYLKNDCLTLQFDVKISNGIVSESVEYKCSSLAREVSPNTADDYINFKDAMKRLYTDKIHADVKLLVDNETILAHKNILSVRSPVFSAMFDSEMIENKTGSVNIPDLEIETVNLLLEYMYTGKLENFDQEIALKLLVAADKYEVLSLKEMCADILISTFSDGNVCDILVVADLVQHVALKDRCIHYIKDNSESIFFSDEWKLVIEKNLQLAMKTVAQVSKLLVTGQK